MKSILLQIDDDSCFDARLQVAMDIARACDSHITCLQSVRTEVFAPGDFYGNAMAAALPKIREAAENLRKRIEADLANEDVSWEWLFLDGRAEQHLFEQSPLHDVIIIGPHDIGEDGLRGPSSMAGELALDSPTPVLIVPASVNRLDPAAPALVAWNGSAEAAVAMRRALPLLAKASRVYLATVGEDDQKERYRFPALDAAKFLSRHGIETELVTLPKENRRVSDVLVDAALARECSMMVMGAYGHSRLAEMLLGGVTRKVLSDPKLPVLLAH